MRVRVISNGEEYIVQTRTWFFPVWRRSKKEYLNRTTPVTFSQQDYAIKYIATVLLKPKPPKKPRWVVALSHREVLQKIERCVHDES